MHTCYDSVQKARERHCLHFNQDMDFISSNRNKCVWVKRIFSVSWVFSDLGKESLGVCLSGHAADTMNSHLGWDAPNSIPRLQLELSFRDTEKALTLLPFFSPFLLPPPPFSPTQTITRCLSPPHAFHRGLLPSHVNMNLLHFSFVLSRKKKIRTSFYQSLQGLYLWDFSEWAIT